ncbi:MAG: hypothetical protein PHR00_03530 [Patescibacteria group bacterium]|nr:hypothetical protein [Patescibacteria group bacterium]
MIKNYFRKIKHFFVYNSIVKEFDKRLMSISQEEKKMQDDFFKKIINIHHDFSSPTWGRFVSRFKYHAKRRFDLRNFLRWDFIGWSMFVGSVNENCLNLLLKDGYYDTLWSKLLKKEEFGGSFADNSCDYDGNTVNHLHQFCLWMSNTGKKITDFDCIIEVGGGYGNFCRLVRKAGFSGNYLIYDLPEFLELQKYYLSHVGLDVKSLKDLSETDINHGVNILFSKSNLIDVELNKFKCGKILLVASWSLSEMPLSEREEFLRVFNNFSGCLIGFQPLFDNVDNLNYFKSDKLMIESSSKMIIESDFLAGDYYYFG